MRKHSKVSYFSYVAERTKESKPFFTVILFYTLFCLASFIYFIVLNKVRDSIMAIMFVLIVPVIYLIEKCWHIKFGTPFLIGLLFIAMGSTLGAGYDLYTIVPFFDTILHTLSGFIFACLGFGLMQLLIGKAHDKKSFAVCLLFGFAMSLAIGLAWELFEYAGTAWFGLDMQEDTIVTSFNSYFLSGTHSETFDVDGIVQTVIYLANGQTVTIDGYLELGLIDTITDMAVCFIGAVVYMAVFAIDWCRKKVLFRAFIPQLVDKTSQVEQIENEEQTVVCDSLSDLCDTVEEN